METNSSIRLISFRTASRNLSCGDELMETQKFCFHGEKEGGTRNLSCGDELMETKKRMIEREDEACSQSLLWR